MKRVLDIVLALFLGILLLPLMACIAILVRFFLGSNIVFSQERPGFHGKPFMIYKFRSMIDLRDAAGNLLPDEKRLTPFGRFLRNTSLDELPELFNVLMGTMSFVGPRPLMMEYLNYYTKEQHRRHEVKPGITGLAQINGRNGLAWEERFKLDVWYVDNQNLWLDIKILGITVYKVFTREGISEKGYATVSKFTGSQN